MGKGLPEEARWNETLSSHSKNHIEADNRLSWLLGRLENTFGNDAFYVHLNRNIEDTIASFSKRIDFGIMKAYEQGILMHDNRMALPSDVARDYIDDGIRCNCIAPGRVHTPFVDNFLEKNFAENKAEMFEKLSKSQPMGRMGKVEEIAALIAYLCSEEAAFITGSNIPIDGGFVTINN